MEEIEKIEINETSINNFIKIFLEKCKPNQFYNKNVFFTQKLLGSKNNQFQVIGNLPLPKVLHKNKTFLKFVD